MSDAKRSILITGANSFVGARLCRKFLDNGFHVIAGVRKTADLSELEELEVEYRYGDVTHPETLPNMVAGVDYLIHNAGIVKAKKAEAFYKVNEQGTDNLFEAIVSANQNLKKAIYISSLAAAGPSLDNCPVTEADQPHPVTTYGHSKLKGEQAALSFADKVNLIAIRPPGIYGPGDKEIFSFFQTVHNKIKPYIGNIQRKLQLVHVDDLCEGIYQALLAETKSGEVYFIAENQAYTMSELIDILQTAIGVKGFPLYIPAPLFKAIALVSGLLFKLVNGTPMLTYEKAGELLASWEISTDKAKKDFGFVSSISFDRGAAETYNWYRKKGWLK